MHYAVPPSLSDLSHTFELNTGRAFGTFGRPAVFDCLGVVFDRLGAVFDRFAVVFDRFGAVFDRLGAVIDRKTGPKRSI